MDSAASTTRASRSTASFIVAGLAFLVPVFIIPISVAPFAFSKVALVAVGAAVLLGLFVRRVLQSGSIPLPRSLFAFSLVSLPVAYLVVSVFSMSPLSSLIGYQLETDTFGFMALGVVVALAVGGALREHRAVFSTLLALLAGATLVFLFQLVQFFFGAPLFGEASTNLIGTWGDFGVFSGLIASLLVLSLETLPLPALHRLIVLAVLALALFFLAVTAIAEVWIVLAVIALLTLVYAVTRGYLMRGGGGHASPLAGMVSGAVLIVSLFFVFAGGGVVSVLQGSLDINALTVRPSLEGTTAVLGKVYGESPIVGSGPNTFAKVWLLHRPASVLSTPFWGIEFETGWGTIPTGFITGGIVVGLAWIFFLVMLCLAAARTLLSAPSSGERSYFPIAATAVATLYLLVLHVVYAPGQTLSLIFFLMLGLFMAAARGTAPMRVLEIPFASSPRIGFAVVLTSVLIALASFASVVGIGVAYAETVLDNRAIAQANAGDLDGAALSAEQAIALAGRDRSYRLLGLIELARLRTVVTGADSDAVAQEKFRTVLASAVQNTAEATTRDNASFDNWFARSLVYAAVVPLQIEGAYENAVTALNGARVRNPSGPEADFRLAEVELAKGDNQKARDAAAAAVSKKSNYTAAILLLAQAELNLGNLDKAIDSVKAAVYFEPENTSLLYQLGILLLEDRSYADAAIALEAALAQQPEFQNAMFFLAQAYAGAGRFPDAAKLMAKLVTLNPDNEIVSDYRARLEDGKNPFTSGVVPPEEEKSVVE